MLQLNSKIEVNDMTRKCHRWSKADDELLASEWGSISIQKLAEKIGCTIPAVRIRAISLKLGPYLRASGLITITDLSIEIMGNKSHTSFFKKKFEKLGLRFHKKTIHKRQVMMINIDEFWEWLKDHQSAVSLAKLEKNILGKEPDWVQEKRKKDIRLKSRQQCHWTKREDERLRFLISKGQTLDEIGEELKRTAFAVSHRLDALGLSKARKDTKKDWTTKQEEMLKHAMLYGEGIKEAARLTGHSQEACRSKCYKLWKTASQEKLLKQKEALM